MPVIAQPDQQIINTFLRKIAAEADEPLRLTDILRFAKELEKQGALFYRTAAELQQDETAAKLLMALARLEDLHVMKFDALERKYAGKPPRRAPKVIPEVVSYVRGFVHHHLPQDPQNPQGLTGGGLPWKMSLEDVFRHGMNAEKDAMAFYLTLKLFIPNRLERALIDAIICEELHHLHLLAMEFERRQATAAGKSAPLSPGDL